MPPVTLVDPATIDTSHVLVDREGLRQGNPQRFEMEQLTAVVSIVPEQNLIIGYKDVEADEFWVRGHVPGYPLLPGVLMCEAAAQLASYYCHYLKIVRHGMLGLGGIDEVRFRGKVKPGDRLVIVAKATKVNRRQAVFETQGFVDNNMVFHCRILGVPLATKEPDSEGSATTSVEAAHG